MNEVYEICIVGVLRLVRRYRHLCYPGTLHHAAVGGAAGVYIDK
jgi:hypothetical protein